MERIELVVTEPRATMVTPEYYTNWDSNALRLIEKVGRVSRKSEGRISEGSAEPFVRKWAVEAIHEGMLEHVVFTACFVGSRAMSLQLVRHRIASYVQESQRYCDYSKGDVRRLGVVIPPSVLVARDGEIVWYDDSNKQVVLYASDASCQIELKKFSAATIYFEGLFDAYWRYLRLREVGIKAEDARYVLPNATKTEVYVTMNLRQWRHVFETRLSPRAQWEIRKCVRDVYDYFSWKCPVLTEGILVPKERRGG